MQNKTVLLGMSGGIDSFVSAILLKNKGYSVTGITFIFSDQQESNTHYPNYVVEAINLANSIQIEHKIIDLRKEFQEQIIAYFKNEYLAGRTPNPCVKCNHLLKWKTLNQEAKLLKIDYISTGHYAKIEQANGFFYIAKGADEEKEQSFFLWGLQQEILKKTLLPLGEYSKEEVKKIAFENGFEYRNKNKESIGICFTKEKNYRIFLNELLEKENKKIAKGKFINSAGNLLGEHSGYPFYTVGQRRGLGLTANKALYVTQIKPLSNTIVLGSRDELYKTDMLVENYYFQNIKDIENKVITKIRYRKQAALSRIEIVDKKHLKVHFMPREWSIAPGQTAAFYIGNRLIGGGFIC